MKDYSAAIRDALINNIPLRYGDFHKDITGFQAVYLSELAKDSGYRKPKNANGSTARYFFNLLQRRYLSTF